MRYPNVKQTLGHLVNILSGEAKRKRVGLLREEIEKLTVECELNQYDNPLIYRGKINRLSVLQNRYMHETGKYHPIGSYSRQDERD